MPAARSDQEAIRAMMAERDAALAKLEACSLALVKADERIGELEARKPQWVSVEERLPALDELVFGWTKEGALSVFSRDNSGGEGWLWARQSWAWNLADQEGIECDDDYNVTHWMELPAPPAGTSAEDEA